VSVYLYLCLFAPFCDTFPVMCFCLSLCGVPTCRCSRLAFSCLSWCARAMWCACRTGCPRRCCVCSICSLYFLLYATCFFPMPSLWPSPSLLSSGRPSALGCSRVGAARCSTAPCDCAAPLCCALPGPSIFDKIRLFLCACLCICVCPGSLRACCLCVRAGSARSLRFLRRVSGRCAPRMSLVCAPLRCLPPVYELSVSGFCRLIINRAARIRGRCVWFFRVYIEVHGAIRGRRASRKSPASFLGVTHGGGATVGSGIDTGKHHWRPRDPP